MVIELEPLPHAPPEEGAEGSERRARSSVYDSDRDLADGFMVLYRADDGRNKPGLRCTCHHPAVKWCEGLLTQNATYLHNMLPNRVQNVLDIILVAKYWVDLTV